MSDIALRSLNDSVKLVEFVLGNEEYGLPIELVKEIIRRPEITSMPSTSDGVVGMINLRGEIIPMVSLRAQLGLPGDLNEGGKVMIVEDCGTTVGLIVNEVHEVLTIQMENISEAPNLSQTNQNSCISAIGNVNNRLLTILDLNQVLFQGNGMVAQSVRPGEGK